MMSPTNLQHHYPVFRNCYPRMWSGGVASCSFILISFWCYWYIRRNQSIYQKICYCNYKPFPIRHNYPI